MNIGDLVRIKPAFVFDQFHGGGKLGVITSVSIPSPVFPYQVVDITYDCDICHGIPTRWVEIVSESR